MSTDDRATQNITTTDDNATRFYDDTDITTSNSPYTPGCHTTYTESATYNFSGTDKQNAPVTVDHASLLLLGGMLFDVPRL